MKEPISKSFSKMNFPPNWAGSKQIRQRIKTLAIKIMQALARIFFPLVDLLAHSPASVDCTLIYTEPKLTVTACFRNDYKANVVIHHASQRNCTKNSRGKRYILHWRRKLTCSKRVLQLGPFGCIVFSRWLSQLRAAMIISRLFEVKQLIKGILKCLETTRPK